MTLWVPHHLTLKTIQTRRVNVSVILFLTSVRWRWRQNPWRSVSQLACPTRQQTKRPCLRPGERRRWAPIYTSQFGPWLKETFEYTRNKQTKKQNHLPFPTSCKVIITMGVSSVLEFSISLEKYSSAHAFSRYASLILFPCIHASTGCLSWPLLYTPFLNS